MNLISFAYILFGVISNGYQGSETITYDVEFQDVNMTDYFYNGVLNELIISANVNGELVYSNSGGNSSSSVSQNVFEANLRFDSEKPSGENVFSAMSEELQMISLERYGTNEYAMSCFDTIEMSLDLDRIDFGSSGFYDFVYTLYIDFGIGENYYYYTFNELITMHYTIDNANISQNVDEALHGWGNGLSYVSTYWSRLVIENDGSYYHNLVLENKKHWEEQGKVYGYEKGYEDGVNSTPVGVLEIVSKPFVEMGKFLNISIAPNLTLGMIIAVPIVVAIIGFLIKALIA